MYINLDLTSMYSCLKDFQQPFNSSIIDDIVTVNPSVGTGYVQINDLGHGINIFFEDTKIKEDLKVRTVVASTSDTYTIFANMLEINVRKRLGRDEQKLTRHGPSGVIFYSPGYTAEGLYNKDERYLLFCITFTRSGLNTLLKSEVVDGLFGFWNETFHYFLDINVHIESLIKQIFDCRIQKHAELELFSLSLKLIANILNAANAVTSRNALGLIKYDINKIFEARQLLTTRLRNPPTITELSELLSMNKTKLKKGFKQIFQQSVYKYSLNVRMLKAKELLEIGDYQVTDVAYMVGYKNISHFAEIFKKQFNVLPSQYLNAGKQAI